MQFKIDSMIIVAIIPLFMITCKNSDDKNAHNRTKNIALGNHAPVVPGVSFSLNGAQKGTILVAQKNQMDTVFTISISLPLSNNQNFKTKLKKAGNTINFAFKLLSEIEIKMSSHTKSGDVFRLNSSDKKWIVVSPDTFYVIRKALEISKISNGAFDPTWNGYHPLYNLKDPKWKPPTKEMITRAGETVGWRFVQLDKTKSRIKFGKSGMKIDLGGIAKGFALQKMADFMKKSGFDNFIINGGGDLVISGKHPDRYWRVAVKNPRNNGPSKTLVSGMVSDGSLVTSGDYERFIIIDKKRYSHIIDPRTGLPAKGLMSVTVSGPDATISDGLATAIFVLGAKQGIEMIKNYPNYKTLIVTKENRIVKSDNFDSIWEKKEFEFGMK